MSERETSPTNAVLSFEEVSISPSGSVEGFSLKVGPGELAIFDCPRHRPLPDIMGLALGLRKPGRGRVCFQGTSWADMQREVAERRRFGIGAVFKAKYRADFLANLDVDENVRLAQLMNPAVVPAELVKRAEDLAKDFGLVELPSVRPVKVNRRDLLRAQWVRAFLPNPLKLLILEQPAIGIPPDAVDLLVKQISRVREEGTAVLWMNVPPWEVENTLLSPTIRFEQLPPGLLAEG